MRPRRKSGSTCGSEVTPPFAMSCRAKKSKAPTRSDCSPQRRSGGSRPNRPVTVGFERLEIEPTRPLHAKCLWFEGAEWFVYVCGSSNFTSAGLGIGATRNLEANLIYVVNSHRDKERRAPAMKHG
jgi:hypothetical protein